jgi:hypothetical protein
MRTNDHQTSDLNRNMHRGNEVIGNASSLSKHGSKSVTHGTVNEVQKEKRTRDEMARSYNDFKEPGTSYARAN